MSLVAYLTQAAGSSPGFQVLHAFGSPDITGFYATAPIVEGTDGNLYGVTTAALGEYRSGSVFCLDPGRHACRVVHHFNATNEGTSPVCLLETRSGILVGSTSSGGPGYRGSVFRVNKDGSDFRILTAGGQGTWLTEADDGWLYGATAEGSLFKMREDGSNPTGLGTVAAEPSKPLLAVDSTWLYSTTGHGGQWGFGTLYRVRRDGSGLAVLYSFTNAPGHSLRPTSPLVLGTDGRLYGVTSQLESLPAEPRALVYAIARDGSGFTPLKTFGAGSLGYPDVSAVSAGPGGYLYGTASVAGASNRGSVFRIKEDGTGYATLRSFGADEGDGIVPEKALCVSRSGRLYGATQSGGAGYGTVFGVDPDGSAYETIWGFEPSGGDLYAAGLLTLGNDGYILGAGFGGLFRIRADGTDYRVIHRFDSSADLKRNTVGLTASSDGWLYGVNSPKTSPTAGGAAFRIRQDGEAFEVLHEFSGGTSDGTRPSGSLVEDAEGWLYGAAERGGSAQDGGTVFRMRKDGTSYQVLHAFGRGQDDGLYPAGSLLLSADGRLYGRTLSGGADAAHDVTTVYAIGRDGSGFQIIQRLNNTCPTCDPEYVRFVTPPKLSDLTESADGGLYCVNENGGTRIPYVGGGYSSPLGEVIRINKTGGPVSSIYKFQGDMGSPIFNDASQPIDGVVEGRDGSLYGLTAVGPSAYMVYGPDGGYYPHTAGAVYRLGGNRPYSLVRVLLGPGEGNYPHGRLLEAEPGTFYGCTTGGGTYGLGTLFRVDVPREGVISVSRQTDSIRSFLSLIPGTRYSIERSASLTGPWIPITNLLARDFGYFELADPQVRPSGAFYRLRPVPK